MPDPNSLNPSIALGINPPQGGISSNPIGSMMQLFEMRNLANQNALFQQTFRARQAMGPIFQQSIDPSTGEIDYNRALTLAGKNPDAAFMVPEIANTIAQRELTKAQMSGALQTQAQEGLKGLMSNVFAPGMADPMHIPQHMEAYLASLPKSTRQAIEPYANDWLSTLVDVPKGQTLTPELVTQRLMGAAAQAGFSADQIAAARGAKPVTVEAGGTTQGGMQSLVTGGLQMAPGGVPHTMTPGEAATPVEGSQGGLIPKGRVLTDQPGGYGAAASGGQSPPGTSLASTLRQGLTPDQRKALEGAGTNVTDYEAALNARVQTGEQLQVRIKEVRDLMQHIRMGGGSEFYGRLAQVAQAFGLSQQNVDKINGGDLGASQEFSKFAVQSAVEVLKQTLAGAVGSKVNQLEFEKFEENNPKLDTDPRAVEKIYNFMTRIYSMDTTEQSELRDFRANGGRMIDWPNEWAKRAQAQGLIQPQEKQSYAKSNPATATGGKPSGKTLEDIFGPRAQ